MSLAASHRRYLIAITATGVSCFLLALVGVEFTRLRGGVSLLWFANAPLLAALIATRPKRWGGHFATYTLALIAVAVLSSPHAAYAPFYVAVLIAETALAAALLRHWRVADSLFATGRSVALFVLAAGVIAPATSALGGAALVSVIAHQPWAINWLDWWLAHGLGNLIATPLALLCIQRKAGWSRFRHPMQLLSALGVATAVVPTAMLVFSQNVLPLLFLPILPLVIATFAYRRIGAAVGLALIAATGGWLTAHGSGPVMLLHATPAVQLHFFDFYLAILSLIALPVAAVLSQRDTLLAQLHASEARYRMLAENATDIMFNLAPDGTIRFASPSVRELGYFEPEELIGRNALELIHRDDTERVRTAHRAALAAPDTTHKVEYRAWRADGSLGWFETNTRAVADSEGEVDTVICVIRDLDERKSREDELMRAATTDPLTGLLNRAAFRRAAQEALALAARGTPSALALLDLDHFKRVNDTHGHAVGDAALMMLADLLRDSLRPYDSIGRIGGEEFAVIFHGLPLRAAAAVCERLCARLAATPLDLATARLQLTMSAGLTEFRPGFGYDVAYRAADHALYNAKAAGRNQIKVASDLLLG